MPDTVNCVYKATVQKDNDQKEYMGLTVTTFKQRFNPHQQSMHHKKYQQSTALLKYAWSSKEEESYSIKWSVQKKAAVYQNTTKRCNLCQAEKVAIIKADKNKSSNKPTSWSRSATMKMPFTCVTSHQVELPLLVFTSSHVYQHLLDFQDFLADFQHFQDFQHSSVPSFQDFQHFLTLLCTFRLSAISTFQHFLLPSTVSTIVRSR